MKLPSSVISQLLAGSSEEAVRLFHRNLLQAAEHAAIDIQRNVHKNYPQFIVISKEIAQMEQDALIMRELLSDLRGICEGVLFDMGVAEKVLTEVSPSAVADSEPKPLGSSVSTSLNSNQWRAGSADVSPTTPSTSASGTRNDLPVLKENVDGLSKLLPFDGPKQLLREGGNITETTTTSSFRSDANSSATGRSVFFFLLNDTLVIAHRKKRVYGKQKMVADKVCPLVDLGIIDMKDALPGMTI
jgi:hypothetical protein